MELLFNRNLSNDELRRVIRNIYTVTNVPKLRAFQYRLLMSGVVLNTQLFKWGIREDNLCSFCREEAEDPAHFFYRCEEVKNLWGRATPFFKTFQDVDLDLTLENVMCNKLVCKTSSIINFLCLVFKHYLYVTRCKGDRLNLYDLKRYVWKYENNERYIATKNGQLVKHQRKWHPS